MAPTLPRRIPTDSSRPTTRALVPVRVESHLVSTKGDTAIIATVRRKAGAAASAAGDFGPYLTRDEARAVLGTLNPPSALGTLCRFLWQAGPRIREALQVTVGDLDFGLGTVRVQTLKRKGGAVVYRWVPIQADLQGAIAQHIAFAGLARGDRLWPWCKRHAQRLVSQAMLAAGVPAQKAHAHAWRHGLAVNAILSGVPLTAIQEQLGHSSVVTTSKYTKLTLADRKAAFANVDFD